jgi:adenylate cyclase
MFDGAGPLWVSGPPPAHPDPARRARGAARRIAQQLSDIEAGIGVSSGEAVAGNVGAEHRLEYTVIGQPVNEAARLSEAAKARPCHVLVARSSAVAAGDEADAWVEAGTVELRGLPADFAVYEPRF